MFSVGFHANDVVAMITTDGFAINRVNAPIVSIKSNDSSIQVQSDIQ